MKVNKPFLIDPYHFQFGLYIFAIAVAVIEYADAVGNIADLVHDDIGSLILFQYLFILGAVLSPESFKYLVIGIVFLAGTGRLHQIYYPVYPSQML